MTIDLDYPIKLKLRGVEYNLTLVEISPKVSLKIATIFDKEKPTQEDFKVVYDDILVKNEDMEKLKSVALDNGLLPLIVSELVKAYMELKKISLD